MISEISAMPFFTTPRVIGLDEFTQSIFEANVKQWQAKYPRNIERMVYLDGKNKLKDLQVSIPPELRDSLDIVMGWPEKAVFEMANRIRLDGIVTGEDDPDPFGLASVLRDNRFMVEFPQAVTSSLAHSTAFGSVTPGDVSAGEPEQLIMFHSALWATGIWDKRRRALSSGLLISETDANGSPTVMTLMLPRETLVIRKGPKSWYLDGKYPNQLGRVAFENLPYRPTLDRPFGRARIDRKVMSLTDRAVRTGARLEVHSEMFSAMKLILLGVGEDAFTDPSGAKVPLWSFYMGRMSTLSRDEEGELPKIEKITAESPEPHIAVWRQLAADFSGHTGVPMSSLGISTDNPESADAKSMAREDIVADAESQHTVYGFGVSRLLEDVVMLRDGLSEPPAEMAELGLKWRSPVQTTETAQAMAGSQRVNSAPWLADTEVGLELLGLSSDQIKRALAEKRRSSVSDLVAGIQGRLNAAEQSPEVLEQAASRGGADL